MANPDPPARLALSAAQADDRALRGDLSAAAKQIISHRQAQDEAQRDAILERLAEIGSRRLPSDLPTDDPGAPETSAVAPPREHQDVRASGHDPLEPQNAVRSQQLVDGLFALVELAGNDHAQAERRDAESEVRHEEVMALAKAGARWARIAAIAVLVWIPTTVVLGVLAILVTR